MNVNSPEGEDDAHGDRVRALAGVYSDTEGAGTSAVGVPVRREGVGLCCCGCGFGDALHVKSAGTHGTKEQGGAQDDKGWRTHGGAGFLPSPRNRFGVRGTSGSVLSLCRRLRRRLRTGRGIVFGVWSDRDGRGAGVG